MRWLLACGLVPLVGCVALTGVGDLREDPCAAGCVDALAPVVVPDGAPADVADATRGADATPDTSTALPVGGSDITLSGTGVAIGAEAVATLTVKDGGGTKLPRTGAAVVFRATGGTSVLEVGAAQDVGDGTYRAVLRGVTAGTALQISATLDGVSLETPPPSIRVVDPVATGLTFAVDAADADGAKNFGGKGCGATGVTVWTDLSASNFDGTLTAFATPPCSATSGWNGNGTPEDAYRLTFDGVDDSAAFGTVNSLAKQTLIVVARKHGAGVTGDTGTGGIAAIFPLVTKGTAEDEMVPIDVNFYLGITPAGRLGTDFEQSNVTVSANNPLTGSANIADGTWYMLAMTLDSTAAARVLYVNGARDGNAATSNVPSSGINSRFVIGGSDKSTGEANGRFKGDIALVRTYDRALSDSEIAQTCHAYSSRFGILTCP